jgi:nucleotide-binding universal stress UspA family protein
MKKILIPLDGSELAEQALDPALRLASRHGTDVVLASVVSDLPPVPLSAGDGELVSNWLKEEEERAARYLEEVEKRVNEQYPGVSVDTRVELGPVSRTLLAQAEEAGAELIALTTHGRGAWQRAWLGSVADGVIRKAHRPVLLLGNNEESRDLFRQDSSPSHVMVPLDGSRAAEQVLDPLRAMLPETGGKVTLISVLLRPFPLASTYLPHAVEEGTILEEREKRTRDYLEEVSERWSPEGVKVVTDVVAAEDVASALLNRSKEDGVDLLALSTRGRGGVSRLVLGSVADKLVRSAQLPVLAVRRAPDESED